VPASQIVFGSDLPYVQGPVLDMFVKGLDSNPAFDESERALINRDNALQLFPRFASVAA
jgi:predicted TIM-barrel fold metal-dependent hydrolase